MKVHSTFFWVCINVSAAHWSSKSGKLRQATHTSASTTLSNVFLGKILAFLISNKHGTCNSYNTMRYTRMNLYRLTYHPIRLRWINLSIWNVFITNWISKNTTTRCIYETFTKSIQWIEALWTAWFELQTTNYCCNISSFIWCFTSTKYFSLHVWRESYYCRTQWHYA